MLKPNRCFTVSIVLGGTLSLWGCTSGQSLRNGKSPGTGGGHAGSGGSSFAAGAGGSGDTGGSTPQWEYFCGASPSLVPCGGTTTITGGSGGVGVGGGGSASAGAGGGVGGTSGRDAATEVGPVDAPSSEAMPDRGTTETSTVVMDSAGIDSDGILRGYQVYGNELTAFEPCGSSELIWMSLSGWEKGLDLIPAQSCPGDASLGMCVRHMYTELTGVISPQGHYGHLSKYSRQLTVQEFLVVTLAESPICPFVPPVFPN